jgi:MFS family permease
MTQINKDRLFFASCTSLLLTAMTFAVRARLETVFGPAGLGLTLEEIGYAFMPAFWGFTIAMILGGPLVDTIGMKKGMWLAFFFHTLGILTTLLAFDLDSLFVATLLMGLGNGMVEAVCNPMVASMYPDQKTKMLNRFHLWWPAGIVAGSIAGYIVMDLMTMSWHYMVGTLFIPLTIYGYTLLGQAFPITERVEMGISSSDAVRSLFRPLYIFIAFCMLLSAATELGTTQRIESLLKETGVNALLVLAFINGVMMLGRYYAGPVSKKLSVVGMLLFSALFSFVGLQLLAISSGKYVFVSAAVFAIGITYFWPTTLAFISENIPESGAFGLSLMGGLGNLSVAIVLPLMGRYMDSSVGVEVISRMSILPAVLFLCYLILQFYQKNKAAL